VRRNHISGFPPGGSLEAFIAAARRGSLSGAADELALTHGAVSRRIQALELWLGSAVFERHGRGVRLTPVGSQFERRVTRSMGAIIDMANDVRMARSSGMVRISVLPSVARLWLVPRLAVLQGDPPDLTIIPVTEHRLASIDARDADLAIRYGFGDWPGVDAFKLFDERLVPVASPRIAKIVDGRPERMFDFTIIHDSDATSWRKWCEAAGTVFRPRAGERRFDDYDLALGAAVADAGVVLARLPLANPVLERADLVMLAGPLLSVPQAHWLVARPGETRNPVVRLIERLLSSSEPIQVGKTDLPDGDGRAPEA